MQNKALYEALMSAGADQSKAEAAALSTPDTSGLLYEILRQNNQILCELDSQKHRQMEFEQQTNLRLNRLESDVSALKNDVSGIKSDVQEMKLLLLQLVKQK